MIMYKQGCTLKPVLERLFRSFRHIKEGSAHVAAPNSCPQRRLMGQYRIREIEKWSFSVLKKEKTGRSAWNLFQTASCAFLDISRATRAPSR